MPPATLAGLLALALPQGVLYVDESATGAGDGSSWTDAFTELHAALAAAPPAGEIWVAEGTYTPDPARGRSGTFFLSGYGPRLYGGFAGHEASRDERAGLFERTVLSGDLLGNDGPGFTGYDDNCHNVVFVTFGLTSLLDGFTITGGSATADPYGGGGGLYVEFAYDIEFRDLRFVANRSEGSGGGCRTGLSTSVQFVDCLFLGNEAVLEGGGAHAGGFDDPTVFTNCRFVGNRARAGGGLYAEYGVDVIGCELAGNTAHAIGGGAIFTPAWARVLSSTLWNNSAVGSAVGGGGVLFGGRFDLRNSILWGNLDDDGGSGQLSQLRYLDDVERLSVDHSCVLGWDGSLDDGPGNLHSDPSFLDPHGADGVPGTLDDDLRLALASPCVDSGTLQDLPWLGWPEVDVRGLPRQVDALRCGEGGVLDVGAHERQEIDVTTNFCPGPPSSLGVPARMRAPCVASVADGVLQLQVGPVPESFGQFFLGSARADVFTAGGTLCVGGTRFRSPPPAASGATLQLILDLTSPPGSALVAGSTWYVQAVFADGGGFLFSDALSMTLRP